MSIFWHVLMYLHIKYMLKKLKRKHQKRRQKSFEKILDNKGFNPHIVMSDNDGAFLGNEFHNKQILMKKVRLHLNL